MKLSKAELKAVVKECLVEILQEGLGSGLQRQQTFPGLQPKVFSEKSRGQQSESVGRNFPTSALRDAIKKEAGGNSVMESILADTAASTLPKMLQNEGMRQPRANGVVEQVVAEAAPEEIFGSEAASKWAQLAFAEPTRK